MKFNLKANPELARLRRNAQQASWYARHRDEVCAKRRKGGIYYETKRSKNNE